MTLLNHKQAGAFIRSQATLRQGFNIAILLVLVAWFGSSFVRVDAFRIADLLFSRDQQGMWHYRQENYLQAAKLFENPSWQATALYKAGQYKAAFKLWSAQASDEALFNQANSLAYQQQYQLAVDYYWLALQINPDWQEAQFNFELLKLLAKQSKATETSERPSPSLEADEVVFDERAKDKQSKLTEVDQFNEMAAESIWLRRLQSTPAEFLRQKFRFQQAEGEQ